MASEAPACRAALNQANVIWPGRRKASDGILSSDAHQRQNPRSDHDHGLAVDLTHDPDHGVDCDRLAEMLARRASSGAEPRVKYLIWDRRIWSYARKDEGWRPYRGANPHTKHLHVSIYAHRRGDTSPWWDHQPAKTAKPPAQEDIDMTKAELQALLDAQTKQITGGTRKRDADGNVVDPDKTVVSVADVVTALERATDRIIAAIKEK